VRMQESIRKKGKNKVDPPIHTATCDDEDSNGWNYYRNYRMLVGKGSRMWMSQPLVLRKEEVVNEQISVAVMMRAMRTPRATILTL
jgi:hypothetical protein